MALTVMCGKRVAPQTFCAVKCLSGALAGPATSQLLNDTLTGTRRTWRTWPTRVRQHDNERPKQVPCDLFAWCSWCLLHTQVAKGNTKDVVNASSGVKNAFSSPAAGCMIFALPLVSDIKSDHKGNECIYMPIQSPNPNLSLFVRVSVPPQLSCVNRRPCISNTSPTLAFQYRLVIGLQAGATCLDPTVSIGDLL